MTECQSILFQQCADDLWHLSIHGQWSFINTHTHDYKESQGIRNLFKATSYSCKVTAFEKVVVTKNQRKITSKYIYHTHTSIHSYIYPYTPIPWWNMYRRMHHLYFLIWLVRVKTYSLQVQEHSKDLTTDWMAKLSYTILIIPTKIITK